MPFKVKVKSCGHSGCALNTLECCGCEDTRPVAKFYACYIDGLGYTINNKDQTRFRDYCPPCRDQFQHLGPGMKRCSCGVVACDLTTKKCCVCLDARYQWNLSVGGIVPVGWSGGYCATCQLRFTPPSGLRESKKSMNPKVRSANSITRSISSSQGTADSVSTLTSEINAPIAAPLQAQLVSTNTAVTIEAASHVASSEPLLKNDPTEVVSEFGDVADYEIVFHADVSCAVEATSGFGICVKMGKSVGGWFTWH